MRCDFSEVDGFESFVTVPAGTYLCRVAEIRLGAARDGSERWGLRLDVVEGEQVGKLAAWDSITWSERGIVRAKHVLGALGFDVSGELELDPADLNDLRAWVTVHPETWEDTATGRRQERNTVPFQGWLPVSEGPGAAADVDAPKGNGEALAHDAGALQDSPF